MFAGLIFAITFGVKLAVPYGVLEDTEIARRGTMVIFGGFFAVMGNAMPKRLTPLAALRCDPARVQAFQRVVGWIWALRCPARGDRRTPCASRGRSAPLSLLPVERQARTMTPVNLILRARLLTAVLAAALAITLSSPQAGQVAQAELAGIEAIARQEMQQRQAPGAAIAVVHGDRVVYTRAFGVANVETGEATRPEMLFRLGSTTKMFTAAAVVLLVEQGKLDLNAPIGRHIPGLAPKLAALTAHQLLSHTSGILDEAPMFGSQDDDALAKEATSWTDARFFAEPGQIYSYSNPGYWLAGLLAAQVGGKPFADQVATSIFAPLGMSRSTFRPTMAMTYPLAQGHDVVDGKPQIIRPAANNSASWPAGSIFTSVNDLSRWMLAFVNEGRVDGEQALPAAVFKTLATPTAVIPGSTNKYGYGVQVGEWRGLQVVEHGGSRSGYGSVIRMVPSQRFGVAVLANRTGVSLTRTANAVIEAVLKPGPAPAAASRAPMPIDAAERGRYVGAYSQGARRMTIEAKGDALVLRQGTRETPLQKVGDLELTAGATRYVFVADASGAVTFLHSGGRSWKKIQ